MRYYGEISKERFLSQVKDIMEDEEFPYEMPERLAKDILKVDFDFENFTSFDDTEGFCDYPAGYMELKPGFHVFFANAGGDWEHPVCFLFYWGSDGQEVTPPRTGTLGIRKKSTPTMMVKITMRSLMKLK